MTWLGDFAPASVVRFLFTTVDGSGVPTTLSGTPDVVVYQSGNTTEITNAVLTVDYDSITGLNEVAVDTDTIDYLATKDYTVVISAGTVDGNSVVGYVVGSFGLRNRDNPRVDVGTWRGDIPLDLTAAGEVQADATSISGNSTAADNVETNITNLDAAISSLNDPTAATIADAVWDEAKSGHVAAGSFGEEVQDHALSSEITALNDLSAAEINAEVDTALADYDGPTKAELDSGLAGLNDPTAASIADAVWDESTTGHTTAGTFGEQVKTDVDAILADTNELQTDDIPGTLTTIEGKVDTVDSNVDAILVDTDTTIPGLINAQNDLSAAEVNAEVDTAIEDYHLDHLLAVDYDPSSKPGTATALLNELVENDVGVSRFTSNALEEAPTGGSAPTAAEIADAVWDEAIADHTSAGSFGEEVQDKTGYSLSGTINTLDDLMLDVGTAQGGGADFIILRSGASSNNDYYNLAYVFIISGTGAGQARFITDYTGSTTTVSVAPNWTTNPDSSSIYGILPASVVSLGRTGDAIDTGAIAIDDAFTATGGVTINADLAGTINGLTTAAKAEVNAEVDTALSDYDGPTKAELDSGLAGLNDFDPASDDVSVRELQASAAADLFNTDSGTTYGSAVAGSVVKETADNAGGSSLTLADIADAVWDEAQADHTTTGTTGESLDDASAGGGASAADIADAVWDEAKSGHTSAGSFGEEVQAHALTSEISALNDVSTAEVNAEVDSALADYDAPTKAEMDAGFSALNNFDPTSDTVTVADINSNVIDDDSLAGDMDVYDARVWVVDNNATPQDNWIVTFYKNGAPVTSGISSPTITVTDASDGSTLVNGDSLTQIGSTVFYKHEEATTRISAGRAYGVQVDWTQDTGSRSAATVLGRDSTT